MEIVVCYFSALSLYIFFLLCLLLLLFALLDHAVHNFHFFPASSFCIYIILVLHFLPSARNIHSTWLTSCTHRLQQPHTRQQQLDSVASFPFLPACLVNWTLSSACCMLLAMVFRDNFIVIFYTFFPPLLFPSWCSYENYRKKERNSFHLKGTITCLSFCEIRNIFSLFFLSTPSSNHPEILSTAASHWV